MKNLIHKSLNVKLAITIMNVKDNELFDEYLMEFFYHQRS